ncbi:tRNA pseudouridine(65) synthase TruC [Endozoicomonas sp. SCSIO W0465]|uniref:tRNA pseudouridine(65) synthase TruC n=1 Tax=Endozoicomonas sp. SCSIO W0465 TaxID=2918516 RepID=UPI0020764D28|nr:tRNA pseudouridine(65) synthase TruC [Endozoicomonas sp. SCSIO W0465]USE36183.1 tRNA pseudouridine(65) synthase TruC [Endozoicomonas sp. SCSIO W0465]
MIKAPAEPLDIIYQDPWLVAINKPSGLLVHRSMIDRRETRFAIQLLRDQIGQHVFPLHRLDKPTSGVLVFALSPEVAKRASEQFQEGLVSKTYLAIVRGFVPESGVIDHPLKEKLDKITDRKARRDKPAQEAVTGYRRLATVELPIAIDRYPSSRYSLVEVKPGTGRKHQIRRHMKHISHPVIGDAKHGKGNHNRYFAEHFDADRLLLHCAKMAMDHPVTGKPAAFYAPVDMMLDQLFDRFGWTLPYSSE